MMQVVCPPERGFATYVCFHNYYERVLKKPTDCAIHLFVYDAAGHQADYITQHVASDCAVQIPVSAKLRCLGMVAVGLVPQTDLDIFRAQGMPVKKRQSAGFYTLWIQEAHGLMSVSHEWSEIGQSLPPRDPFYVSFPSDPYIDRRALLVFNPHATESAGAELDMGGERQELAFNPLQCHEVALPDACHKAIVRPLRGRSFIAAPLTAEYHPYGGLHIHHS